MKQKKDTKYIQEAYLMKLWQDQMCSIKYITTLSDINVFNRTFLCTYQYYLLRHQVSVAQHFYIVS